MKDIKNYIGVIFFIMILLLPNKVFAETLHKEQIMIDTLKNKISFICSDGEIKEEPFEEDGILINEKDGVTYISINSLFKILNHNTFQLFSDEQILQLYFGSNTFLKIDKNAMVLEVYRENKKIETIDLTAYNEKIFLPLRKVMNLLGYDDNHIIYNPYSKIISLNKQPIFETDKIIVTDYIHNSSKTQDKSNDYFIFEVVSLENIYELISAFNEAPLYSCKVAYRTLYPWYTLDFNNGTVIEVMSNCVCKIYIYEDYIGQYQLPFDLSFEIENFIKDTIQKNKVDYNIWWYDTDNGDMSSYEYLTYDYMDNDYSKVIDYIKHQVENFDEIYNYHIDGKNEEKEYFVTLVITNKNISEDMFKTSFRLYKYPGSTLKKDFDLFLYALK